MDAYYLIFTGCIAEGTTHKQVKENLLLLGCPAGSIQHFFAGKPLVLKKNLPLNRAEAMAKMFAQAGALCRVQKSGQILKNDDLTENLNAGEKQYKVVSPVIGPPSLHFAPMQSPFLTAAEGGLNINRKDKTFISFEDISLLAMVYDSGRSTTQFRLLIFIRQQNRPYAVDAHKIAFSEFPEVKGDRLLSSLRLFLKFLLQKNSSIMIDEESLAFLKGGRPRETIRDINVLSTALAAFIQEDAEKERPAVRKEPSKPIQPAIEIGIYRTRAKGVCNESFEEPVLEASQADSDPDKVFEKAAYRKMAIIYSVLCLFFCLGTISFISNGGRPKVSSYSNLTTSVSPMYKETPEFKKMSESLEYNRKMAKVTNVVGIIIFALLAIFFFRKAFNNWTRYKNP